MGQGIKRFDFVPRDPPQVGFESRVIGDYPARFGEHLYVVCAGEWKPPQERSGSSHVPLTLFIIMVNQCIKMLI